MMTSTQYLEHGREALDVASSATDPETRAVWEATAHYWLQLAEAADLQSKPEPFTLERPEAGDAEIVS